MIRHARSGLLLALATSLAACTGDEGSVALLRARASASDSLVLRLPRGRGVYYTSPRQATAADGSPCFEFALEIRDTAGGKRLVPLLYTRDRPVALGDTAFEARLWNRCAPGDWHRVSLATGLPVKVTR